jgi:RNA polymerase sigma factor (sigma-70 family)
VTPGTTTLHLQACLDRLRGGDAAARDELLRHSQQRLRKLAAKMLARMPAVRRWEDTDDVLQRLLLRMDQLVGRVEVAAVPDYLCLAATNLRRVLIDLIRHYQGPHGLGANYATPPPALRDGAGRNAPEATAADSADSLSLDDWSAFHEKAAELPDDERAVFDLLWYHGLSQEEAAGVLAISLSTLKRRWQSARVRLAEAFQGRLPG